MHDIELKCRLGVDEWRLDTWQHLRAILLSGIKAPLPFNGSYPWTIFTTLNTTLVIAAGFRTNAMSTG
ncbi:hypothetical protein PCAR4_760012 [Paraburkholderia caribensis]|nr:hypothetical protein PCAR4_760012 [Paraburkholderia caribensis]